MPVTRRESRASQAGLEGSGSLEQILDHFEQFRRKHIAQNRDIVRANTLAQLRIRELESRVLALEQERAEQVLEAGQQKAQVRKLEYALECVRVGWETMAQGLHDAGVDARTGGIAAPAERSTRIALGDTQSTRVLVARSVAPMAEIAEEHDGEEDEAADAPDPAAGTPHPSLVAESPGGNASPSSPTSPFRAAGPLQGDVCPASVTRRRSRRHSHQMPEPLAAPEPLVAPVESPAPVEPAELMEPTERLKAQAELKSTAPFATSAPAHDAPAPAPATPPTASWCAAPRNEPMRASPATPTPHASTSPTYPEMPRKRARLSRVSAELGEDLSMPLGTRRARKSVNYALPKLNTKMRKPDSDDTARRARTRSIGKSDEEAPKAPEAPEAPKEAPPALDGPPEVTGGARPEEASPGAASPAEALPAPPASEPNARATPPKRRRTSGAPPTLLRDAAPHPTRAATPHTKRPLPPSARPATRSGTPAAKPFVPRGKHAGAVLQQHSAHNIPSWASSLLNLASPEPPTKADKMAPRATPSAAAEQENRVPASPSAARSMRRARRGTLE